MSLCIGLLPLFIDLLPLCIGLPTALCNGLLTHCHVHEFSLVQVARDLGLKQDGVKYLRVAATLCRRLVEYHYGMDWGKDSVRAMRVEIVHGVGAISLPGTASTFAATLTRFICRRFERDVRSQ